MALYWLSKLLTWIHASTGFFCNRILQSTVVCLSCCEVRDTGSKYSEIVSQYYFESSLSADFFLYRKAVLHGKLVSIANLVLLGAGNLMGFKNVRKKASGTVAESKHCLLCGVLL